MGEEVKLFLSESQRDDGMKDDSYKLLSTCLLSLIEPKKRGWWLGLFNTTSKQQTNITRNMQNNF